MPCNPTAPSFTQPNQTKIGQPIANFDRLGLPVQQASGSPATMEQVAFQMLQLKRLMESAFQLEGFSQATANSHTADTVVVEYAASEGLYRSFKNQPLELRVQLILAPARALTCVAT